MKVYIVHYLLITFALVLTYGEQFSYKTTSEWKSQFPECGGRRQSPVALSYIEAVPKKIPSLIFHNYDVPVTGNVKAINNGHTIQIDLPKMNEEEIPCLYGGGLNAIYRVKGFHFHWGSSGVPGSEHSIDGIKHDIELHIVHKKYPYHTLAEARPDPVGIVVLAVLFQSVQDGVIGSTELDRFYEALPHLSEHGSEMDLKLMKMGHFLGQLNTEEFFTYNGSLTTPPCIESAVWFVFPNPLPIQPRSILGAKRYEWATSA